MTKADRSLDVARDDSGAVNSPSTSFHCAQNDNFYMLGIAILFDAK